MRIKHESKMVGMGTVKDTEFSESRKEVKEGKAKNNRLQAMKHILYHIWWIIMMQNVTDQKEEQQG